MICDSVDDRVELWACPNPSAMSPRQRRIERPGSGTSMTRSFEEFVDASSSTLQGSLQLVASARGVWPPTTVTRRWLSRARLSSSIRRC